MAIEVVSLHIYPVKGLRGISVPTSKLTPTGLAFDRHWMIVLPNGRMVTQRQMASLATLVTKLENNRLTLCRGGDSISIELDRMPRTRTPVSVWQDSFFAREESEDVSAWLTNVLAAKHPLRLVRMDPHTPRPSSSRAEMGRNVSTQFADAAPLLVTNTASLDRVNECLMSKGVEPVGMDRFRPNIVVCGLDAFAEYRQAALHCDDKGYTIALRYPSERCIVTTIDQQSGEKNPDMEPLATLLQMNNAPNEKGAYFGQNASLLTGAEKMISKGDSLRLELNQLKP